MKKILVIVTGLVCALALTANAAEGRKKTPLTDEQKTLKKEMTQKYDANKDGKIDKDERAKMTSEDKKKWSETFGKKKQHKKEDKQEAKEQK